MATRISNYGKFERTCTPMYARHPRCKTLYVTVYVIEAAAKYGVVLHRARAHSRRGSSKVRQAATMFWVASFEKSLPSARVAALLTAPPVLPHHSF